MDGVVAHPPPARARRLGERLAAARRPAHADRHRAARRRRARGARGGPAPRGAARRGHRARARHPSPSRPRRPRRHDQAALGRHRGRARPDGGLCGALLRRGRARTAGSRARSCATTVFPSRSSPTPRSFWDYIRATDRGLPRRRAPRRRRSHPGRRAQPAGRRATRATARRTRCSSTTRRDRVRRRSPAGDDLLEHGDLHAPTGPRWAGALARALPGGPGAHGRDAARPAPHRPRRAGHASTGGSSTRACATIAGAASASSRILDDGPAHGVRDRLRPVARADGDASSRCSSSGRWSATSSCCSTPALWPSAWTRGLGLRADPCGPRPRRSVASAAATPPAPGPRLRGRR